MSSILLRSTVPSAATAARKRCGSLVCRCTRRRRSPPATTSDSPRPSTAASDGRSRQLPAVVCGQQGLRAEAEPLVDLLVRAEERRHPAGRRLDRRPARAAALQGVSEALEEVHEALAARVHHVVGGQYFELVLGVGERAAGGHEAGVHHRRELLFVGAPRELPRPGAQHREDGALARLLEGEPGGVRALPGGRRELRPVDALVRRHGAGQPVKELGEDRPRVAARALQGAVGGSTCRLADAAARGGAGARGGGLQRRRQVGTGVGVAHREDVDAVERLLLPHHVQRAGAEDPREAGAVERPHGARGVHQQPCRIFVNARACTQSSSIGAGRIARASRPIYPHAATRQPGHPSRERRTQVGPLRISPSRRDLHLLERLQGRADTWASGSPSARRSVSTAAGSPILPSASTADHAQQRIGVVHGEAQRLDRRRVAHHAQHVGGVLAPVQRDPPRG